MVAQVDVRLERLERLLSDLRQREHRLEPAALTVLERREAELAGVALEHHAPCDADHGVGLLTGLQLAVLGADRGDRVGDRHADRVRLAPCGDDAIALGAADLHLLGQVVGDRLECGHRGSLSVAPGLPAGQPSRSRARSRIGEECVSPPTDR